MIIYERPLISFFSHKSKDALDILLLNVISAIVQKNLSMDKKLHHDVFLPKKMKVNLTRKERTIHFGQDSKKRQRRLNNLHNFLDSKASSKQSFMYNLLL